MSERRPVRRAGATPLTEADIRDIIDKRYKIKNSARVLAKHYHVGGARIQSIWKEGGDRPVCGSGQAIQTPARAIEKPRRSHHKSDQRPNKPIVNEVDRLDRLERLV